jgi:hypothetical protein
MKYVICDMDKIKVIIRQFEPKVSKLFKENKRVILKHKKVS